MLRSVFVRMAPLNIHPALSMILLGETQYQFYFHRTVGTCGKDAPDYCVCPDGNKVSPPAELVKATAEYLA